MKTTNELITALSGIAHKLSEEDRQQIFRIIAEHDALIAVAKTSDLILRAGHVRPMDYKAARAALANLATVRNQSKL